MSVREILERAQEDALGLDGDAEASVWRNACEEALATLYAETVREILSGGERTISPGGSMEQRPDWRPYLQESSAELIVLPRAAVEALRDDIQGAYDAAQQFETHATCSGLLDSLDALLAAAKPVMDAGSYRAVREGPFILRVPVERGGEYRVFFIAADAAEEG